MQVDECPPEDRRIYFIQASIFVDKKKSGFIKSLVLYLSEEKERCTNGRETVDFPVI